MAKITNINIYHLFISNLLILNVIAHVIETVPLCGTMDGSPLPKDSDKIYFKDRTLGIRTVEINGKVYACYPDGTMVDTTSSKSSESNETIDESTLNSRIQNDDAPKRSTHPVRQIPSEHPYMPNVNRCAERNQTYCTSDGSYPTDVVEKLMRKHLHKFADVFGSDSLVVSDVKTRIGEGDEVELCESYEQVIYPTSGRTQDGTSLFIINTPEHKQGVRVSICLNAGVPCKMSESFPNNYRTECKQHMVNRELLSLSPDGSTAIKQKFPFPACCSCAVYRI